MQQELGSATLVGPARAPSVAVPARPATGNGAGGAVRDLVRPRTASYDRRAGRPDGPSKAVYGHPKATVGAWGEGRP